MLVYLLVQFANGRRAYPGQIHLNERLLHTRLTAAIALDDLCLERQLAQLRHPQLHLGGFGVQLALVMPCARVSTRSALRS